MKCSTCRRVNCGLVHVKVEAVDLRFVREQKLAEIDEDKKSRQLRLLFGAEGCRWDQERGLLHWVVQGPSGNEEFLIGANLFTTADLYWSARSIAFLHNHIVSSWDKVHPLETRSADDCPVCDGPMFLRYKLHLNQPCGHQVCLACLPALKDCPVCLTDAEKHSLLVDAFQPEHDLEWDEMKGTIHMQVQGPRGEEQFLLEENVHTVAEMKAVARFYIQDDRTHLLKCNEKGDVVEPTSADCPVCWKPVYDRYNLKANVTCQHQVCLGCLDEIVRGCTCPICGEKFSK